MNWRVSIKIGLQIIMSGCPYAFASAIVNFNNNFDNIVLFLVFVLHFGLTL